LIHDSPIPLTTALQAPTTKIIQQKNLHIQAALAQAYRPSQVWGWKPRKYTSETVGIYLSLPASQDTDLYSTGRTGQCLTSPV